MLSFSCFGSPTNPPVLFLHGFLGCKEDFLPIAKSLQDEFYCICVDLPGHGSPMSEDILNPFLELQNALSLEKTILVGYSMGGRLAMMLREEYSEKFPAAVIMSAHIGLKETTEKESRKSFESTWEHSLESDTLETFLDKWYNQPLFATLKEKTHVFEEVLLRRKKHDPVALLQMFRKMHLSKQTRYSLFKDTLFLFGDKDHKYRDLYKELPRDAQIENIPNSGHCVHLENPSACAEKLFNFMVKTHNFSYDTNV
jgi:2-succinyl-6-hydroxy-2,4-cyclohexadiene-1-carboxylate synthase